MNQLDQRVNFDLIRYANCWEDADLLLEALAIQPESRVLSIASAGDNSFSLLGEGPALVCAVDLSLPQLYLTELKRSAFAQLTHQEMLEFLGFSPAENRWKTYQHLRKPLTSSCREYWDHHRKPIEAGLISQGKLEKYFRFFARRVIPLIHTSQTVEQLLQAKNAEEQSLFYHQRWNNWRWRLLFRIFFSKAVMGKFGRDPEFLRQVEIPVSTFMFQQAERHLQSPAATENPLLQMILTGSYADKLPHYLREENFEAIVANLDALEIRQGYAHEVAAEGIAFDRFNLSNIFEYMDMATFREVSNTLLASAAEQARLAYWNLMAPRNMSELWPDHAQAAVPLPNRSDMGFFYHSFHLESRILQPAISA